MSADRKYEAPSPLEVVLSRFLGFFAGLGFGPSYVHLLEVRGRKSGKLYSTPLSLLAMDSKQFLVAPRGRTQWVRNAEAAGEIILKKRGMRRHFRLRALTDAEKPEVLKKYLASYRREVQRFFPVKPDASLEVFAQIAEGYPVFELIAE